MKALPSATNHTTPMIHYAMRAADVLYKPGYNFNKAGAVVDDLIAPTLN